MMTRRSQHHDLTEGAQRLLALMLERSEAGQATDSAAHDHGALRELLDVHMVQMLDEGYVCLRAKGKAVAKVMVAEWRDAGGEVTPDPDLPAIVRDQMTLF